MIFLGHGRCVAFYKCDCDSGWAGASCALPDCAGANQCSGQGECVSSNTCQCYPGFQGVNCSEVVSCASLGNCSGNGVCMQQKQGGNSTCRYMPDLFSSLPSSSLLCHALPSYWTFYWALRICLTSLLLYLFCFHFRCYAGFSGVNCSLPLCLSVNNCSGHGQCLEADLCYCDVGYTGADCSNASCEGVNYCSGEETHFVLMMMREERSSSNATLSCYSFLNLLNPLFRFYKKIFKIESL